ncbi:MAG: glycosyltransferase family 4 protein [Acidiferrobacterales bacterium]|nr:glycosyltransferase family 4 protein [Acidiferrobacterales bacterium]
MQQLKGIRICIVVENLPCPFDRRVWQEAGTLHAAGAQVCIISPKAQGYTKSYELLEGIHIYRHPLPAEADSAVGYLVEYSAALFWQIYLSFKISVTRGLDIIHGCNPPDLIFLVALLHKPFGKKYVFDHHDINPELFRAKFAKEGFFYKLICLAEKLTFKTADMSIATNESYKEIAIQRGGRSPASVHVVRSGPRLDRLRILPPDDTYKHGKKFLVGYVGVMGKQEGVDGLLRAINYIVRQKIRTDIHFYLVGSGTEFAELQTLMHKLELDEYVTFTGRIPDEELLSILNTADVCVNPDVVNEMNDKSTMNKIMEYMALAKPIVQYDMKEGRFSAREASVYALPNNEEDFANKILDLLDQPELRKSMGEFGRQRVVTELSWDHESTKLVAAYQQLIEQKKLRRL